MSNTSTTKNVLGKYLSLPQGPRVQATYIWIGSTEQGIRSKTKTLESKTSKVEDLPVWKYSGSKAEGSHSDTYLLPVKMYPCPFRRGDNVLALCEAYEYNKEPAIINKRKSCKEVMDKAKESMPCFGIEQEYTLLDQGGRPLGWPKNGYPEHPGPYYCGVGATKVFGRDVVEAHYRCCMYAGVPISGTSAGVVLGSWGFQVGPCKGVDMGDDMWVARYLLQRVAEDFRVVVSFDPKPLRGDWNGTGAYFNYSTKAMREKGGMKHVKKASDKLSKHHIIHIKEYDPTEGKDNIRRLTEAHETSSITDLSSGVENGTSSIQIPREVSAQGSGYLVDRRPASNCDPYSVTMVMVKATCLGDSASVGKAAGTVEGDERLGG